MEKTTGKKKKTLKSTLLFERHFSAGGVVYKNTDSGIEWLLIQPAGTNRWQFPKGGIDKGESSSEAAIREVGEETGVTAEIKVKINQQQYFFVQDGKKIFKTVIFYLMCYKNIKEDSFDKKEVSEIRFAPLEKALELLSFKNDRELLLEAANIQAGETQNLL